MSVKAYWIGDETNQLHVCIHAMAAWCYYISRQSQIDVTFCKTISREEAAHSSFFHEAVRSSMKNGEYDA